MGSNMRKISSLIFLAAILIGCTNTHIEYQHSTEFFVVNDECLNVCWMGIKPEETTAGEAYEILKNSSYIDQKSIDWYESPSEWYPDGISARWLTESSLRRFADIGLEIKDNKIRTMWFSGLYPITIRDSENIFGEPDKINIAYIRESLDGPHVEYTLFYHEPEIIIQVFGGNELSGPHPDDIIDRLILNYSLLENPGSDFQELYKDAQLWLGYDHLEEYLPNREGP